MAGAPFPTPLTPPRFKVQSSRRKKSLIDNGATTESEPGGEVAFGPWDHSTRKKLKPGQSAKWGLVFEPFERLIPVAQWLPTIYYSLIAQSGTDTIGEVAGDQLRSLLLPAPGALRMDRIAHSLFDGLREAEKAAVLQTLRSLLGVPAASWDLEMVEEYGDEESMYIIHVPGDLRVVVRAFDNGALMVENILRAAWLESLRKQSQQTGAPA